MRVFHLIKGLGRGGAETLLLETQRVSAGNGVGYGYGFLLPWKNALVDPLREAGGEVVCFDAPGAMRALGATRRIARHLRAWNANLLHCHLPLTGIVGRLAGRSAGVPVVYTEHNLQQRYHPLTRWASGRTWALQELVLAVSGQVADSIRRQHGSGVPVEVLHNGVDTERFAPDRAAGLEMRRRLGIAQQAPVVGTVAVFRRQKNLRLWLEAARLVRQRCAGVQFLLVGDGPLSAELQRHARQAGLADAVHWPGLQVDVRPYVAAMDVYLMSSTFEGLPVALLEAMAMESSIVTTRVGGIAEAVDATCARLLPANATRDEIAGEVCSLLAAPRERGRLGTAARARAVAAFSLERMVADLETTYSKVLHGG